MKIKKSKIKKLKLKRKNQTELAAASIPSAPALIDREGSGTQGAGKKASSAANTHPKHP